MATTRTTIAFDDDLLRRLKKRAASEGRTVQALVNDLVRGALAVRRDGPFSLELGGFHGVPAPGIDELRRPAVRRS
jgi:plasmid stability protein